VNRDLGSEIGLPLVEEIPPRFMTHSN